MPHGAVCRADIVYLFVNQLFESVLHGRAILAYDVRIIAHHFEPEGFAIYLIVEQSTVKRTETSECVARKQHVIGCVERHHRLWPVNHGRQEELQRALT